MCKTRDWNVSLEPRERSYFEFLGYPSGVSRRVRLSPV
jgi:hypothetical protein